MSYLLVCTFLRQTKQLEDVLSCALGHFYGFVFSFSENLQTSNRLVKNILCDLSINLIAALVFMLF